MSKNTRRQATPQTNGGRSLANTANALVRQKGAGDGASRVSPQTGSAARRHTGATQPSARRYTHVARRQRMSLLLKIGGAIVAGVAVLAIVYYTNTGGASGVKPGQPGQYRFDVASPAAGATAPNFSLPSTTGGAINLADYRSKNVLLFFQEGIGCEGCWTQLKDIQSHMSDFTALGIDAVITITTNPLDALKQKVADEGITLPVLSDESFTVSRAYNATAYGMMAGSADGHTFLLVGPDDKIRWRADYGGPPDYTMYVPISNLAADIQAGIKAGTKAGAHGR